MGFARIDYTSYFRVQGFSPPPFHFLVFTTDNKPHEISVLVWNEEACSIDCLSVILMNFHTHQRSRRGSVCKLEAHNAMGIWKVLFMRENNRFDSIRH